MDLVGDTLHLWAKVLDKRVVNEWGLVRLEAGIRNSAGVDATLGGAQVLLPLAGGPPVPYPFDPARL